MAVRLDAVRFTWAKLPPDRGSDGLPAALSSPFSALFVVVGPSGDNRSNTIDRVRGGRVCETEATTLDADGSPTSPRGLCEAAAVEPLAP